MGFESLVEGLIMSVVEQGAAENVLQGTGLGSLPKGAHWFALVVLLFLKSNAVQNRSSA
jgi:hypothetical protein